MPQGDAPGGCKGRSILCTRWLSLDARFRGPGLAEVSWPKGATAENNRTAVETWPTLSFGPSQGERNKHERLSSIHSNWKLNPNCALN